MKKPLNLFLLTLLSAISFSLFAQDQNRKDVDYTIKGQIKGISDTTVYLANYYGNKLYYNDTTYCDKNGNFSFMGKPFDEQGKYAIVIPGPKYFDILVAGENIEFTTDTLNLVEHLNVKKSVDNKVFFDYMKYINEKRKERSPYEVLANDSTIPADQKDAAIESIKKLNDEVMAYQNNLVEQYGDRLIGKYILMTLDVEIPTEVPEGEEEQMWRYMWYRNHYWDHCDLTDNRIVRDQTFHKLLEKYVNKVLPQIPDSISIMMTDLIDSVEPHADIYKYMIHYTTYNAQTSNIMCMDKVMVNMVDTYYKKGKATWMTDEKLAELIEASDKKKPTLCDEIVPNIILPDTTDVNWKALYDVDAKYTAIVIWESTCGHCKKEMPKLKAVYDEWHDKGLEIYAIGNDYEREPWKKFIRKHGIGDWIHVSDDPAISNENPDTVRYLLMTGVTNIESLNFRNTFDVFSTPKIYLLDEDKRVIAKQLNSDQI
ncbi:MAG: redoxin domain-containing protein, partial [Flavobacteriales bacterium]|nr:redoxin domain-containing protein [Flavobacteriales bacterium]